MLDAEVKDSPTPDPTLELDHRIVAELCGQWRILNRDRFKAAMRQPLIRLHPALPLRASWQRVTRTLLLDERFARHDPWGHVLDALAQQVVHQWVDEVRGFSGEPAHTALYLRTCAEQGLGCGTGHREALSEEAQRALRRVMQLFALAESENQHEAEAAMAEAQRLMLKHNLKVTPEVPRPGTEYDSRCVGRHKSRFNPSDRALASILNRHFFVGRIFRWLFDPRSGKRGRVLEIYGTQTNLEMASYVFDFLERAADRLWRDHRRRQGLTGDRQRRSFVNGVMEGFLAKLDAEKRQHQQQGLVWLGDPGLKDFDERRYPKRNLLISKPQPWDEARKEGFEAGQRIELHRPLTAGQASPGAAPRPATALAAPSPALH